MSSVQLFRGRSGTALIQEVRLVVKLVGDNFVRVVVGNGQKVGRLVGHKLARKKVGGRTLVQGIFGSELVGKVVQIRIKLALFDAALQVGSEVLSRDDAEVQ